MHINYTDKPQGMLPLSKGMADWELNMGKRTKDQLLEDRLGLNLLGWFLRQALANPGVLQVRYHEENGYEFEDRAIYDEATNIITTNEWCPVSFGHHVGQTCGMCGMKD